MQELIEQFESDKQERVSEIIILGENGAVRRILFHKETKDIKYIG